MAGETLTTLDTARVERLVHLCHRVSMTYLEYSGHDPNWLGAPESEASREQSYCISPLTDRSWRPGFVASAYHLAQLNTALVASHALSLARLISEEAPPQGMPAAADAISRAGIEAAARAWWLLEPSIGPTERVVRYLADMVYSSYEAEEYVGALGHPKADAASLGLFPTVSQHTRMCNELGFSFSGARSRNPVVNGSVRPSNTSLVNQLIGDTPYRHQRKAVYSLTSGSQHATTFAILRNYVATGAARGRSREIVPLITQEAIDFSVASLLTTYIAVMRRAVYLLGWGHITIDMFELSLHKTFR